MISVENEKENVNQRNYPVQSICINEQCINAFCRPAPGEIKNQVQKILKMYGSVFECRNTNQLINSNDITILPQNKNMALDLFLYINNVVYGQDTSKKLTPQTFKMKKQKPLQLSQSSNKGKSCGVYQIVPANDLEHTYCHFLYAPLVNTDKYILIGVLQLMLHKFHKTPNFLFGLVIIRIFNVVIETEGITDNDYSILYSVYNYVYHKISEAIVNNEIPNARDCGCGMCAFHMNFSKTDLVTTINTITKILDGIDVQDTYSDRKFIYLFEILRLMHKVNLDTDTVNYEAFYLHNFFGKIEMKDEFRKMKAKKETPIKYKFSIPVVKKAELLKLENCDKQKTILQDSFFRALFEGLTDPYLVLKVRREFIYEDTLAFLSKVETCDFKKQLKISFLEEEGVDSGGIIKEFFQMLSHKIAEDTSLFVEKNNTIWLKPGANQQKLKLVGIIIGIALYNNVILNIPFSPLLFKKFFNDSSVLEDLELIEPEIYNSLKCMNEYTTEQFKELEMTFEASYEINGELYTYPLVKNGARQMLTKSNYAKFKMCMADFYVNKLVSNEFNEVLDGFYGVIIGSSIEGFNFMELEKIVMGSNKVNFEEIKRCCIYHGYSENSAVVKAFWAFVEEMSEEEQINLLKFVTGNDRLPIGGAEALNFTIMKNGCDTERLPSAQTCFNTILLPEYSTREKLYTKLKSALEMTAGFYLM